MEAAARLLAERTVGHHLLQQRGRFESRAELTRKVFGDGEPDIETDQIGHAILWMVGTVLIGSLRMMRRPLAIVGIELAALSLFSEFAQPLVSMNRGFEPGDAMANLVGVGFGVTALAGVVLLGNVTRLAGIRR